mmetsp:Transcript_29168/g.59893  ORF Transcript_29168/g.59893 Transcript_29168/m.59893 type:complete len:95 (+) Transcript_29168:309-593(+)
MFLSSDSFSVRLILSIMTRLLLHLVWITSVGKHQSTSLKNLCIANYSPPPTNEMNQTNRKKRIPDPYPVQTNPSHQTPQAPPSFLALLPSSTAL